MDRFKFVTNDGKEVLTTLDIVMEIPTIVEMLTYAKKTQWEQLELAQIEQMERPQPHIGSVRGPQMPNAAENFIESSECLFVADFDRIIPDRTLRLSLVSSTTLKQICQWIEFELESLRQGERVMVAGSSRVPCTIGETIPLLQKAKSLLTPKRKTVVKPHIDRTTPLTGRKIQNPKCDFLRSLDNKQIQYLVSAITFFRMDQFKRSIYESVTKSLRSLTLEIVRGGDDFPIYASPKHRDSTEDDDDDSDDNDDNELIHFSC